MLPIVELQITTEAFLAAQLLQLQTMQLTFPAPFSEGGLQFVVDHVEFGQNSLLNTTPAQHVVSYNEPVYGMVSQEVNGFRPQISQPITVYVVSLEDVESHPDGAPAQPVALTATIILGMEYNMFVVGNSVLSIAIDRVDMGTLPPLPPGVDSSDVTNQFLSFVQSVPIQPVALNLASIVLQESDPGVINMGMAVSSDLQRIAFRQETGMGLQGDPSIWQDFYAGNFTDRLLNSGGEDSSFAVFESGALVEQTAQTQIASGLTKQAEDQEAKPQPVYFELLTGVSSSYSDNSGTATITSTFGGNVHTPACTVGTDVTVVSTLSVSTPNAITIDTKFSWNTDTTVCTVLAGALGGALGIFPNFVLPLGSLLVAPLFLAVSAMTAVLVAKNVLTPSLPSQNNCQQVSDTEMVCTQAFSIQDTPLGKLAVNTLVAEDDGISLQGNLLVIPVGNPELQITADSEFGWHAPAISCGEISGNEVQNFRNNPKNYVSLAAGVSIWAETKAPIFLISAQVINDPRHVFDTHLSVQGTQAPIQLAISLSYPGDQFLSNPYPCQILVLTTGGARLISIAPPPALSQTIIDGLAAQVIAAIGNCQKLVSQWWNIFHQYNPVWSVDPGNGETVAEYGYEFSIRGLEAGETASLVGERGQVLQTGIAQAGTALVLSTLVAPSLAGQVGIVRDALAKGAGGVRVAAPAEQTSAAQPAAIREELSTLPSAPAARGIGVTERLLIQAGSITLTEPCRSLSAGYVQGVPCALITMRTGVFAYDISNPGVPALRQSWSVPGLRGILVQPQALLAYGREGFTWLGSSTTPSEGCSCCDQPDVHSVVAAHGYLYALTNRGLEVLTPRLNHRHLGAVESLRSLAYIGKKLVAGGRHGLAIFSLGDPARPEQTGFFRDHSVAALAVPPVSNGHQLLVVPHQGDAQLLDFADHGREPKVVARMPVPPWYLGSARVKNLILRPTANRMSVTISYYGRSAIL